MSNCKYLMYFLQPKCVVTSKIVAIVSGNSGLRSRHCAVGVMGVIGTFLLPRLASFPMRIPVQSSVLSANDTMTDVVTFLHTVTAGG